MKDMKKEEILDLFEQFEQASCEVNRIECWSARELHSLLGYHQRRNFTNVIDKAKEACQSAGQSVSDHFADVSKMIKQIVKITSFPPQNSLKNFNFASVECTFVDIHGTTYKNANVLCDLLLGFFSLRKELNSMNVCHRSIGLL